MHIESVGSIVRNDLTVAALLFFIQRLKKYNMIIIFLVSESEGVSGNGRKV